MKTKDLLEVGLLESRGLATLCQDRHVKMRFRKVEEEQEG